MRIEMAALGPLHGREDFIISKLITLFATLQNIRSVGLTHTSFRQLGIQDAQPDIAFYLGSAFQLPPRDNQPINVSHYGPPQLAVEIASTTLSDDLGRKRLLYERLGVQEYWVVDAAASQVIAFAIAQGRSGQIEESLVLPRLRMSVVAEALQRSQTEEHGVINRWLLALFNPNKHA
jgi:Uma2 family endonuclease